MSARRNVDGHDAGAIGTFSAATACGMRSDGNSGARGCSGSSQNSPRTSSMYHHSSARPSSNRYASRWPRPGSAGPLALDHEPAPLAVSQWTSPIRTPHSSAARTPEM